MTGGFIVVRKKFEGQNIVGRKKEDRHLRISGKEHQVLHETLRLFDRGDDHQNRYPELPVDLGDQVGFFRAGKPDTFDAAISFMQFLDEMFYMKLVLDFVT